MDAHDRGGRWAGVPALAAVNFSGIRNVSVDSRGQWTEKEDDRHQIQGFMFEFQGNLAPEGIASLLEPWLEVKPQDMIFGVEVGLSSVSDADLSLLKHLHAKGLRLVHWRKENRDDPVHRSLLWQTSKAGIWNHVSGQDLFSGGDPSGTGFWIANNPNIVHSFNHARPVDRPRSADSPDSLPAEGMQLPKELLSYGGLPEIPGVPFWQILEEPGAILAVLGKMGKEELLRLRAASDRQEAFFLGSRLDYHFKRPEEIAPRTMDEIVAMVDAGGSVDITHVRANLEKAYLIAYVTENGVIAGNSSLKHPRQVFIDRLNRITGLDFTRFVERGYTSVRPEYRAMGIGAKLLEGLTSRATDVKVFSLISEDNLATQKIAMRNNTRKIAVYFSDKVGKEMGVWMPEHMIDSNWGIDL